MPTERVQAAVEKHRAHLEQWEAFCADLGEQPGFDDNNEVWDCAECGHDNPISEDVIFDPWEFLANFDPNKFGRS